MKVYVIGGKAKSGKNTLGEFIKEELKEAGYKPCIMHITEPLYNYARNYFMWDSLTDDKPREFLQKMGIEIIKEKMGKKKFLLNRLYEDIEILSNFFDAFVITDARLKDEFIDFKKSFENVVTIKLVRNNYDDMLSEEERKHITEVDIDNYNDFDVVVENTSIDALKEAAKKIVLESEEEII